MSTVKYFLLLLIASMLLLLVSAQDAPVDAPASEEEEVSSDSERWHFAIHGWVMWLGFGVFMPLGIISSRHLKCFSAWFQLHYVSQLIALGCILTGFSVGAHYFWNATKYTQHARLGVTIVCLSLLQPFIALVRPGKDAPTRPYWFFVHWLLGMGAALLGLTNLYSGLELYHEETGAKEVRWLKHLLSVNVAIIAFIYLFLDRLEYIRGKPIAQQPAELSKA